MSMEIVGPKTELKEEDKKRPFFYLLGPSKGTDPWHLKMCEELKKRVDDEFLVYYRPSSEGPSPLPSNLYKGESSKISQVRLEIKLLQHAGIICPRGCIITWLSQEKTGSLRVDGSLYACDTAYTLGGWSARIEKNFAVHFAWGGDTQYPGLHEMCEAARESYGEEVDLPFYSNMENLVSHAVKIALTDGNTLKKKEYSRLPS